MGLQTKLRLIWNLVNLMNVLLHVKKQLKWEDLIMHHMNKLQRLILVLEQLTENKETLKKLLQRITHLSLKIEIGQPKKILRDLEREKEKRDKEAYMDPKLALEAKEKGNEAFQSGDFPKAIALYTEAIERDPTNAPFYSNRAAAYMKVADFGYAYKDCEKCIELDPTFVKAYKRKALIHNYNKDFHKAIDCYNKCLELNPEDGDAKTGLQNSRMLLAKAQSDPEQREIRRQRAMADPEIQQILQNPMVERLLQNLSPGGDQAAAMKMMNQDPSLREAFEKLLNSGAIHMGP